VSVASPTTPPASPTADPAADPAPSNTCKRLLREEESSHSHFVNGLLSLPSSGASRPRRAARRRSTSPTSSSASRTSPARSGSSGCSPSCSATAA
jgi:hypothetical protein